MSNFQLICPLASALVGDAAQLWTAVTSDSAATATAAGYLNDKVAQYGIKANDRFMLVTGDGGSVVFNEYIVTYSAPNYSLVAWPASGYLAVANNLSDLNNFLTAQTNLGLVFFDVTVGQGDLASAGSKTLVASSGSIQYKVRQLFVNKGGTNFSGNSGDRLGSITDGTTVYSLIPAASLQTLANTKWGDTGSPAPASVGWNVSTAAGAPLVMKYSGGSADYSAGSVVISGLVQRVA